MIAVWVCGHYFSYLVWVGRYIGSLGGYAKEWPRQAFFATPSTTTLWWPYTRFSHLPFKLTDGDPYGASSRRGSARRIEPPRDRRRGDRTPAVARSNVLPLTPGDEQRGRRGDYPLLPGIGGTCRRTPRSATSRFRPPPSLDRATASPSPYPGRWIEASQRSARRLAMASSTARVDGFAAVNDLLASSEEEAAEGT